MIINLAKESDMLDVFELANDPVVRKNSFNSEKIELENHKKWFLAGLRNQNCYFYIIREDAGFVGSVRFDLEKENQFIIGIQISKQYRGKGLASEIIENSSLKFLDSKPNSKIIANIKEDNVGSLKAFLKVGYKVIGNSQKNNSPFYILEYQK